MQEVKRKLPLRQACVLPLLERPKVDRFNEALVDLRALQYGRLQARQRSVQQGWPGCGNSCGKVQCFLAHFHVRVFEGGQERSRCPTQPQQLWLLCSAVHDAHHIVPVTPTHSQLADCEHYRHAGNIC